MQKQKLRELQRNQLAAIAYRVVADTACSCVTMSSVSVSTMTCVTLPLIWLYLSPITHPLISNIGGGLA